MNIDLPSDHQLLEQLRPNLPSPLLGKTGWPWTEGSPAAADVMPDGSPWPRISIVTLDDVPGPLSLHNLTVLGTTSPGKPDRAARDYVFTPPLRCRRAAQSIDRLPDLRHDGAMVMAVAMIVDRAANHGGPQWSLSPRAS